MIDRHDEDGQAYIAYYRRDHTTGFIWTGNSSDPVQVTREMGEPVIDTFEVAIDQDQSTEAVLVRFKAACDRYLEWDECAEGDQINDDNPGRPICRTCDDDPNVSALYPKGV